MKKLLLNLCLILVASQGWSQVVVRGRVFDGLNKESLEEVVIFSDQSTEVSIQSDSAGFFSMILRKLPAEIAFTRIGYYDEKFRLTENEIMLVYMEPSSWMQGLEITDSKTEVMAGNSSRSVFDFALLGRYLVVCDYGNTFSDSRLICFNENGDTLAKKDCPQKPRELFTDCEGNAYFQGKDSTYQILYTSRGLELGKGKSNQEMLRFQAECLEKDGTSYYYGRKSGGEFRFRNGRWQRVRHHDEIYYYYGDRVEMSASPFWAVIDKKSKELKNHEQFFSSYFSGDQSFQRTIAPNLMLDPEREFFFRMMLREIYAPLVSMKDTLFIFDHPNGNIHKFNRRLEFLGVTPIRYSFTRDFKNLLLHDEMTNAIYLLFEKGQVSYLCELNPHNGIITREIPFDFPFVSDLCIRNGWVYFVHRDANKKEVRLLSRMQLPKKGT